MRYRHTFKGTIGDDVDLVYNKPSKKVLLLGGDDSFILNLAPRHEGKLDLINGGAGQDTLKLNLSGIGVSPKVKIDLGAGALTAKIGAGVYEAKLKNIEHFADGGTGTDSYFAVVKGTGDANTITVGDGGSKIIAGGGDDIITGGAGKDVIKAGGGGDTLTFGHLDRAFGGAGIDTLILRGVDTSATNEMGRIDGGRGKDTLNIDALATEFDGKTVVVDLSGGRVYSADNPSGWFLIKSVEAVNFSNANAALEFDGSLEDDTVVSSDGNDLLMGNRGDDDLNSGAGDDRVEGGAGDDTIQSGTGADTIVGGSGKDLLIGTWTDGVNFFDDNAVDTFVFAAGDSGAASNAADEILHFEADRDLLDFSGISASLAYSGSGPAANSVWFEEVDSTTNVQIDYTGDGVSDMLIIVSEITGLTAANLVL